MRDKIVESNLRNWEEQWQIVNLSHKPIIIDVFLPYMDELESVGPCGKHPHPLHAPFHISFVPDSRELQSPPLFPSLIFHPPQFPLYQMDP